jgi:hypothetical protein
MYLIKQQTIAFLFKLQFQFMNVVFYYIYRSYCSSGQIVPGPSVITSFCKLHGLYPHKKTQTQREAHRPTQSGLPVRFCGSGGLFPAFRQRGSCSVLASPCQWLYTKRFCFPASLTFNRASIAPTSTV